MAIRAELADGRVLEFPDDTDQSVIDQTVKRAIENPYSTRTTKELEAVSAAPSTFKDVSEFGALSLAGGIKGLTDLFGVGNVASKKMEELQRDAFKRLSPERQQELAIEEELARRAAEEGTLAEIKQAGKSFLRSPLQQGVGAAFSSLPVIAATALAPQVSVPAALAGRAGLGAAAARTAITNAPGIAVGAGMGVGSQKGQDYERVKQAMLERGATEEEAEAAGQRAAEYSMQNAARQAAAGVAGGAEAALGIESLIGRAGRARPGAKGGAEAPTFGGALAQSTLGETIPEAVQSGVAGVGSNIALQQAGIDTDLFKGVAGEVTSGALAAALLGSAVSPLQMRQLRQEFARDQQEKQLEELKKAQAEYEKQQAQISKTKEELGTQQGLALPAPAPKVEEKDPLHNPLGNLTKNELGPEVVGYIEQYRTANGMPLLNSYSIEDVKDAMTQVNPAGEAAALDSLVAAKSGYQPDVTYSAQDVLNAATNKVDTSTQGFLDFLNRTTGSSDLNTMSQPQLYAAFKALEGVPVGQGLTILPEGSNASRFTEAQMDKGLDKVQAAFSTSPAVTPEQAISIVKKATKLKQDRDAATLLKQLVRENHLDVDADGNFIAPTKIENLPAGYTLEKGTFKQGDQQLYGVIDKDAPLEGVDTYTSLEQAQEKADSLNKVRKQQYQMMQQRIQNQQNEIDKSQLELDAMEAAGEGGTNEYKQAKAKHDALVEKNSRAINTLSGNLGVFERTLTAGPVGMKQVNRTGFTLFKDGVPVSTHPTVDAAMDSLVGTLPDAEVEALAQDKTPGMRTVARKARQRIEGKEQPQGIKVKTEKKPVAEAPEAKEEAKTLAETLAPILKKFGLGDVQLQIIKGMEDEGSYVANLIKIALDAKDAIGVLRHESIHALKDLGFFSPQQWTALERMAKEKWIDQYLKGVAHDDTRSRYDAYVDEYKGKISEGELEALLIEEAIADAFRAFGDKPPPGMISALINKIKQFFERLNNALNAAGYQSAEDVFGKIERGELEQEFGQADSDTKKPSLANAWKATPQEVKQADKYEEQNGILPYVSEGRLDLPTQIEKKSIKTADKYGMYQFDPVLNIPLNKDGTVTVYYHTTKEEALKINDSKVIPSNGKARIYLTNESNGAPIVKNRGNFDQTLDGSTVILNVPPSILQVDQNYDNGRIDFFVPMAQGDYFNRKMRMASIQKGRQEAIVETFSYKEHEDRITAALAEYNGLDAKGKKARLKQAGDILKKEHNVGTLLTENGKLEKTRLGDFEIEGYDGNSITSMGLGLAAAQQISEKVSTCPRSAICEGLCLGETSGGNFLYGGAASEDVGDIQKSAFRAAARMFQYLKTEALIVHPEEFAIKLQSEIDLLKRWATKNGYDPAVRLNVTSDFKPDMFSGLINANSGVMFYDYTKLNNDPIAPNHHLTYSSTGFGQIVNGEPVFFKNKAGQYDHNWGAVRKRLDDGYGVAMAFSSKSALPKALFDEETGKTYQIWDGDLYDARFLDPKADDGVTGQIVGLRNKAATLKEKTAASETGGFFIDYDPKRDGDTVTVPDQSQFKGKVIPIAKKSLRSQQDQETIADGKERQDLYDDFSPDLKQKLDKLIEADRNAEGILVGRFEGKEQQRLKSIAGRALRSYEKAFDAEFPGSDITAANVYTFVNRDGRFWNYDKLIGEKKSLRAPETKEFKQFFGRSKVVDKDGNPLVVYHATSNFEGNEFKPMPKVNRTGNPDGYYFTYDIEDANRYAGEKEGSQIIPVYLNIQNPYILGKNAHNTAMVQEFEKELRKDNPRLGDDWIAEKVRTFKDGRFPNISFPTDAMTRVIEAGGYDGIKDGRDWVAFNSQQIKSAIGNIGTYSIESPDIRKSLRAPDTQAFKQWFGESKIVNEDGTPMVMYHGSRKDFAVPQTRGNRNAFFVSPDPNFASKYALNDLDWFPEKKGFGPIEEGAQIYPVYISAKKPFDYENDAHMNLVIPQFKRLMKTEEGFSASEIDDIIKDFREGRWSAIEFANDLDLFELNGFDAFYTKEQGRKNLGVFKPQQVKSATGNMGTYSSESPDIRKSLRAPNTKEFNDWFSDSKAVDKEGRPVVMYHGTARDISEFKPGVANAIFVSPDPEVGAIYSADSLKWISENAADELTPEQKAQAIEDAVALVQEEYSFLNDPEERKQPDYKKMVARRDDAIKDIKKNAFTKKPLDEKHLPFLAQAVRDYLPVGENIMPVFVRAVNPFDYENKKHLDMVINQVLNFMPESVTTKMEFPEKYLAGLKGLLSRGLYNKIEDDAVQKAIRSLGFDSFYVKEHGVKNLGVYSPVQLKSATGNVGAYDINNPDIRKSLRPQIDAATQTRINETIGKRDDKSWLERLMTAIAPQGVAGFRQAYINRYETIGRKERLIAKMKGLPKIMADVSAESAALFSDYAAQLSASAFGVNDGIGGIPVYQNGITKIWNDNGKIKGPIAIFKPLAELRDPEVFRDWQFWMSAKRGSRLELDGREKLFTQADLAIAKNLEAKYPPGLFESVRKEWDTYNRGLVEYMIQTGVINKQMGESWMKHGDYFPFYRQQMDDDAKGPKVFSAISGVKAPKALKGGDVTVGDFFENVVRNTQSAIEAGMKNVAAERAIQNEVYLKDAVESLDFKGQPKRPSSMINVVTVLRNGQMHYYECVDAMFVEAMKGLNMAEIPGLQLFAAPANLLRSFVTKTPDFILANLLRDSMAAWVTSGAKITPIIDTAKGFTAALAGKDKDLQTLLSAGLIGGQEFTGKVRETGKTLEKQLKKAAGATTTKEKIFKPFKSVWEALEKGSTASDAATRLAVYKDTYAQTGNEAEALMRAMEIMNFQRKGSSALIRILTAVTPFLNARIQGLDVLYRAGIKPFINQDDRTAYDQAIAKAFIKRGLSLMALSCLYYAMVHDDEDYLAQEEETRDNNWLIPALGVKIPIPFEVGVIFKVMPERIMAYTMGNDTGEQLLASVQRNLYSTFGLQLPQAVLPAIEVATNYSFFTGRPIIGQGMEDVDKEFQVDPGTSKFAEILGQFTSFKTETGKSVGLSPIQIDHLIKGYTGTLGTYAVDAMDTVIGLNSDIPKPSRRFEQMPFIRRFALDPEARGNVTAYYELKNAVDQAVRTSNLLERTGKVEDFVEYQMDNMPLLASKDYVNALYKNLKEFNDMKRFIRSSTMDADDKRDALLAIGQSEAALVSQIRDYKKMIAQ